jgi:hypothetical protein
LRKGDPVPIDDRGRRLCSDPDYSWVDGVVTKVVSYYQSDDQLNEIPWIFPGSWALEGPKGSKRVCSRFRGCGFVT